MAQAQKSSFADLIKGKDPVLVDFWAPWCGPCRMMEPAIKQLAEEYKGRLKIIKINVDNNPEAAQRYGIQGVPTLILFRAGQVLMQQSGAMSYPQLQALVSKHL